MRDFTCFKDIAASLSSYGYWAPGKRLGGVLLDLYAARLAERNPLVRDGVCGIDEARMDIRDTSNEKLVFAVQWAALGDGEVQT